MTRTITDELGRMLTLPDLPQRIVSLVPSLTEWLFAIGCGERVVGVTDFCLHPANDVATKIKLRGTKNPDRTQIAALAPDLVIAAKEENRERDVDALTAAGFAVYVTDPQTVAGAIGTLHTLAEIVGAEATAEPLLHEMRVSYAKLNGEVRTNRPRVLVPIWRDPWMAIGARTYADDLLRVCGAYNVAAELNGRYPRFELGQLPALKPDLVLLPSEPYKFSDADLPALQNSYDGPAQFVDGELLTWYGPRIGLALRTFASLLR